MILHAVERGAGPPVALLHGLFGQAVNFATVQRRLGERFRTLALDLRNHGMSPHAPTMTLAEMAEDVRATLRAHDALPCALVGHSLGGKVAMTAALQAPDAVPRLLVGDIAPVVYGGHGAQYERYLAAMAALPLTPGLTRAAAEAALAAAVPDAAVRAFLLQSLQPGAAPRWRINLAGIGASLPEILGWAAPAGATYAGPTLFLAGARSDYVRPEHRPAIRALFPRARFASLKSAGHWLHADNADGFVAAVEGFLQA
ncbi:MAG: alpha/beta fold hydrolase [Alphaproteobacteria bacterium]|nr:alpha/beta fold hydrolase [Alphaproteobacteria bacterium]